MSCVSGTQHFHLWSLAITTTLSLLLLLVQHSLALNRDGMLLLTFKFCTLSDPLHVLDSWSFYDDTPCSWHGVSCSQDPNTYAPCVLRLSLPNSQLLGSVPSDLGLIKTLQYLDLSNNSLNGSLPSTLFNMTELRYFDISDNMITGNLPLQGTLQSLQVLNLSDNALTGMLPPMLCTLSNLTAVSLKNNYFSGELPVGFDSLHVFDLSSNLINGSLPQQFGGRNLSYFNISYNRVSGPIPPEFGANIPSNATLDLSFNNLTGEIPNSPVFLNQKMNSFAGNPGLCGERMHTPCPIPSSPYYLPNASTPNSSPAIAVIPKQINSISPGTSPSGSSGPSKQQSGLQFNTIIAIVAGDVAGVAIVVAISFYFYYLKKKKNIESSSFRKESTSVVKDSWSTSSSSSSSEAHVFTRWSCLRRKAPDKEESDMTSSDNEDRQLRQEHQESQDHRQQNEKGTLVTVDGEKELELETLLKASAYILGATGSSIMYKAVLEDGTSLAVRRIGENHVERFKAFESQVRVIAKLVHPNLVKIRGFYWGVDEKLIIYDFVPNGSLANSRHRKVGSSPCHLPWEARVKIAKGVARGLSFLHEKKHVHGNLKPSNILLGSDMEPRIGDFGLERLVTGDTSYKAGASARNFGSNRSTASRDSFPDFSVGPSPSPSPSSIGGLSPYLAPESLRSLKPNPKWDVYSFGVILLELLTGKVIIVDELGQGNNGLVVEDPTRALRMADVVIRADLEGQEDALLAYFKLGYSCASPIPQKRPSMKEALQVLDKFPSSTSSFLYGH